MQITIKNVFFTAVIVPILIYANAAESQSFSAKGGSSTQIALQRYALQMEALEARLTEVSERLERFEDSAKKGAVYAPGAATAEASGDVDLEMFISRISTEAIQRWNVRRVSCPTNSRLTGCIGGCHGDEIDMDLNASGNSCVVDSNTSYTGDKGFRITAICLSAN